MLTDQPSRLGAAETVALLELAPDGIYVADREGRFVYVNAAGAGLVGQRKEDILGRTIADLVHPDEIEQLREAQAAMLAGHMHRAEWRLRHRDGHWVPVEVTANVRPDGQWHGFARDITQRRAQEAERDALHQQAERDRRWLHAVIDCLPVAVALHQVDGAVSFNHHCEQLVGMPLSTAAGSQQYVDRIRHPDGTPLAREDLPSTRALEQGETVIGAEYLVRRSDGSEVVVLGNVGPITDADGRVLGAVSAFQELSPSMQLEREVRENEVLLAAVFELLPVGVSIADGSGRIVRSNATYDAIWRGSPQGPAEGVRKGWWVDGGRPIGDDEWPVVRAATRGKVIGGELARIQCYDGSTRTVIKSAAPLRDERGQVTGAIVVDEDVTTLYETQQKLQAGERLLRTVLQLLPVGVWIADADGRIVLVNPAGERLWQGSRHVGPAAPPEYKAWWVDTGQPILPEEWGLMRAIRQGQTSRTELIRIQCFDGSLKTVINWAAPIRSESGEITGAVALNEDVTSLYQTQEQLRSAVRDREHILAVVAHDLRNPLNNVRLRASLLEHQARALPNAEHLVEAAISMFDISSGMAGLVDDLLAVSVARSNRSMLSVSAIAPAQLLKRVANTVAPTMAHKGLELRVEPGADLPPIQADQERIVRVFTNLLDNAVKFTERGGHIVLGAEAARAAVVFSVANSGPPLRAEEMERLFQPFWQAGREDRRGAGLGLSICRSIIEAHGGTVWTESAPGMRMKVLFLLPCAIPEVNLLRRAGDIPRAGSPG